MDIWTGCLTIQAVKHILQNYGKKQFSQLCKGDNIYTNSILVDEDGNIVVIQQIVDDKYDPLILTKLN